MLEILFHLVWLTCGGSELTWDFSNLSLLDVPASLPGSSGQQTKDHSANLALQTIKDSDSNLLQRFQLPMPIANWWFFLPFKLTPRKLISNPGVNGPFTQGKFDTWFLGENCVKPEWANVWLP